MSRALIILSVVLTLLIVIGIVVNLDGSRLEPTRREVLVKEVDNGYVVLYRTTNNPYPVREAVARTKVEAAEQVHSYLGLPVPDIQWGK